jgi:hypothetical protein
MRRGVSYPRKVRACARVFGRKPVLALGGVAGDRLSPVLGDRFGGVYVAPASVYKLVLDGSVTEGTKCHDTAQAEQTTQPLDWERVALLLAALGSAALLLAAPA